MLKKEKVIETKNCKHCDLKFEITDKDLEFYEKVSPVFDSPYPSDSPPHGGGIKVGVKDLGNGKIKYLIPTPTLCPDCRQQRRLSFRNERVIYSRRCDSCDKNIVSIYNSDSPYKVYCYDCFYSDRWDMLSYGKLFDFNKTFFEQYYELSKCTPKLAQQKSHDLENSEFTNHTAGLKDCYLIFASVNNQNCIYDNYVSYSNNIIDGLRVFESQLCYECVDCKSCQNLQFSELCKNCSNSKFLYNCDSCESCFMCTNLTHKSYCFENIQLTKEDYINKLEKINFGSYSIIQEFHDLFHKIKTESIHINLSNINTIDSIGNNLLNTKNCNECYDLTEAEDCKYVSYGDKIKYVFDAYAAYPTTELSYEVVGSGINSYRSLFTYLPWGGNDLIYCINALNCKYCFGCNHIYNKSYCILNKQYTKEEYEKIVPKIIEHMIESGEWGEFFPSSLSPFGYNETVAMEYFPITRDGVLCHSKLDSESFKNKSLNQEKYPEINPPAPLSLPPLSKGNGGGLIHGPIFNRSDYESPKPKVDKIIPANKLPEDIKDIPDDILNWAIMPEDIGNDCNRSLQKPFRIIREELDFYRKHNLSIPRRHPDQRHLDRMKLRNPRKLYDRNCDKCGKEVKTTYSPDRKEIVYCEECYNKEIY